MIHHTRICLPWFGMLALLRPDAGWTQGAPLLQITAIQAAPGQPVELIFNDFGTQATNYLVEFAPTLNGGGVWSNATSAVVQPLGNGNFRAQVPDFQTALGFFRVRGYGGAAGVVSATFNATTMRGGEGEVVLPTITFSAPYHGLVRYSISGTAAAGDYVSLSGEIFVDGTSATIPVSLLDNAVIGQLRYLTLTLLSGPALHLGAGSVTTINIEEDDGEWQGSFNAGGAMLGFTLGIEELNSVRTARLIGDGFGFFPTNEIPVALHWVANEFAAAMNGIPVAAGATFFNEPMSLSLHLNATNGVANQGVDPNQVQGIATLISTLPAKPHLNTTNVGTFLLLKPPVKPATNQVELVNIP